MKNSTFWIVIVGVLVFCASQYILKLIMEPMAAFRRVLSDISSTLLLDQQTIMNAHTDPELAVKLRLLAAELRARAGDICFYGFLAALQLFNLPDQAKIFSAFQELNNLSHNLSPSAQETFTEQDRMFENAKTVRHIGELLRIETSC